MPIVSLYVKGSGSGIRTYGAEEWLTSRVHEALLISKGEHSDKSKERIGTIYKDTIGETRLHRLACRNQTKPFFPSELSAFSSQGKRPTIAIEQWVGADRQAGSKNSTRHH